MSKSFLFELREAARTCPNVQLANKLRGVAGALEYALDNLTANGTRSALELVNGRWAYAYRILCDVTDAAPAGNGAGLVEGAELQRMAA